VSNFLE